MGLLRIFIRRDSKEEKAAKRAAAEREQRVGDRQRRQSRQQLSDWEGKHGASAEASRSSDERTLYGAVEKVQSNGSGSTLLSLKGPSVARSVDFLPKLELGEFGTPPPATYISVVPGQLMPAPVPGQRDSTYSARPALAPIQPQATPEWDSYVTTRHVGVAPKVSHASRASRTMSMFSLSHPPYGHASTPQLAVPQPPTPPEDDDDDDIPLALAVTRTRSSPSIPRPSTMYDLSPTPSSSAAFPRSHSRASLTMPAILAQSTTPPLPSHAQAERSPRPDLGSIGRRHTLIDLSEPSRFDPYHQNQRMARTGSADRIVVGDRRKKEQAARDKEEKRRSEGPKIMDFEELESRHKKRMSMLQTTANDHVATESAKKAYQQRQQREAEQQRRKEAESARRRSVSSNLHLAAGSPSLGRQAGQFGAFADDRRSRSSMSISGLSAFLKLGGGSSAPSSPNLAGGAPPSPLPSAQPAPASRSRRQSTQALVSPSPVPRQNARPSLRDQRRHSLGTLLEASQEHTSILSDLADLAPPRRPYVDADEPFVRGRTASSSSSLASDKVAEWQRRASSSSLNELAGGGRGSVESGSSGSGAATPATGTGTGSGASSPARRTVGGKGEWGLLQKTADEAPAAAAGTKKKHSWLDY
ncbi:hypothetical protein JCM10207_000987 [Rhodosporidiobolus poonsookiae]